MKIISKYKDYYDYLVGKYGMDEKLVLDRTSYIKPDLKPGTIIKVCVLNFVFEGIFWKNKYYWREDLLKLEIKPAKKSRYSPIRYKGYKDKTKYKSIIINSVDIRDQITKNRIYVDPVPSEMNYKENVPILLYNHLDKCTHYPILKEIDFFKAIPADAMWTGLSQWLSDKLNVDPVSTITDKEKVVSHGFDLKKSFRHRK